MNAAIDLIGCWDQYFHPGAYSYSGSATKWTGCIFCSNHTRLSFVCIVSPEWNKRFWSWLVHCSRTRNRFWLKGMRFHLATHSFFDFASHRMFGCQYSAACILKVNLCHPKSWASSPMAQSFFLLPAHWLHAQIESFITKHCFCCYYLLHRKDFGL